MSESPLPDVTDPLPSALTKGDDTLGRRSSVDSDQPEGPDDEGQGDSPSGEDGGRAVWHRRHRFPARTW